MNSRMIIQVLVTLITLLLVVVFLLTQQMNINDSSSPQDYTNNNKHMSRHGGKLTPDNLRGRFKSYDITHPVLTQLQDPIDKQQEQQDKEIEPKSVSGEKGGGGDVDDVFSSFMERPKVLSPPVVMNEEDVNNSSEINFDEGKGNEQSEDNVLSPTMSHNDHQTNVISSQSNQERITLATVSQKTTPSLIFPFHESYPIVANRIDTNERHLFNLYFNHWEKKEQIYDYEEKLTPNEILKLFHSGLKYGKHCEENSPPTRSKLSSSTSSSSFRRSSSSASSSSTATSPTTTEPESYLEKAAYWEVVTTETPLFFEFSSSVQSSASLVVSLALPTTISVLFDSSSTYGDHKTSISLPSCNGDIMPDKSHPPSNVIVSKYPLSSTFDYSSSKIFNNHFNCVQLISSIEAIFTSTMPLPYDVEDALGEALCRCNTTLLPSTLPKTNFFAYWNDMDMLINEAIDSASRHHLCNLEVNETGTMNKLDKSSSSLLVSNVKYVHRTSSHTKRFGNLTTDDFFLLDLSHVSRSHLMSSTLGDGKIINNERKSVPSDEKELEVGAVSTTIHLPKGKSELSVSSEHYSAYNSYSKRNSYLHHQTEIDDKALPSVTSLGQDTISKSTKENITTASNDAQANVTNVGNIDKHASMWRRRLSSFSSSFKSTSSSSSLSIPSSSSSLSSSRFGQKSNYTSFSSHISTDDESRKHMVAVKKEFGAYGQPRQRASFQTRKSHWILPHDYSHSIPLNREILEWINRDIDGDVDLGSKTVSSSSSKSSDSLVETKNKWEMVGSDLPPTARRHQKAVRVRESRSHFQRWMNALREEASVMGNGGKSFLSTLFHGKKLSDTSDRHKNGLVYVFGRYSTMLSVKLAKMLKPRSQPSDLASKSYKLQPTVPTGVVVTLLTDSASWMPHRDLGDAMGLQNNIVCHGKLTLETIAALSAAPEHPNLVVLQQDIFTTLLLESFLYQNSGHENSNSDRLSEIDDVIDIDTSSASFLDVESGSDTAQVSENIEKAECFRALDLFEEVIATLVTMGEKVYLEVPILSSLHTIIRQVSPSCSHVAEERYDKMSNFLKKISSKILVSKQGSHLLCGGESDVDNADNNCLHLEVRFMDQKYDKSEEKKTLTKIYGFSLAHYSQSEFNVVRNATRARNAKKFHRKSSDKLVQFSASLNEVKERLQEVNKRNRHLSLWSRAAGEGISVYTLLHLGVEPQMKKVLLKQYIDFPFIFLNEEDQQSLTPWKMFVKMAWNSDKQVQDVKLDYLLDIDQTNVNSGKSNNAPRYGEKGSLSPLTTIGVSSSNMNLRNDLQTAQFIFDALQNEFSDHRGDISQDGKFSFVEHNSEYGFISAQIAQHYMNASVVSLERDMKKVHKHVSMLEALQIENNVVCSKGSDSDSTIFQRIYESPELFRYQLVARGLLESFANTDDIAVWGSDLGSLLSSSLSTFLVVPSSRQVSLAMNLFLPTSIVGGQVGGSPYRSLATIFSFSSDTSQSGRHAALSFWEDINSIKSHPTNRYKGFETIWLLGLTKAHHGSTEISFSPVYHNDLSTFPLLIRCDLMNMTRHVHHHYDYAKDGHKRTYTMRVEINQSISADAVARVGDPSKTFIGREGEADVLHSQNGNAYTLPLGMHPNQHQIVSVKLHRDKDNFPIPYTSIYGITLISILRLGLYPSIRDRLFKSFLFLPLYEDMAPWNIVLMGKEMAYIDYDTRDVTFDAVVPKAYQVISVLMNYKRTVEDFKKCGRKADTVYGLAFISDCVGEQSYGAKTVSCPNLNLPVPCGDGTCHSDYISCLRSYSDRADALAAEAKSSPKNDYDKLPDELAKAMRSGIGIFSN